MKGSVNKTVKEPERTGENCSEAILRVTEGKEVGVRGFLQTIDPVMHREIAEKVKSAKAEMDGW